MDFIFSAEIDSIQRYIVTSNKMWTIRAGSYILNKFNEEAKDKLTQHYNTARLIYSSAGSIKTIFKDEESAEKYGRTLSLDLKDKTEIASLSWAVEKIEDGNISSALRTVEREVQEKRNKRKTPISIINHPLFIDCEICKNYPALQKIKKVDEYLVCNACLLKFKEVQKRLPIYDKIDPKRELFDDFKSLVKDDYLALICSDGNRLGEHLIELSKKPNSAELLKNFSDLLNEATINAFKNTVSDVFKEFFEKEKVHFPFMTIVLGGDDIAVVMPARHSFTFARKFTEEFISQTKEFPKKNLPKVSISTGIAIAKHTFPFSNLYELAEELLSNAKRLSRWLRENNNQKGEYSTVDFEVITGALAEDISQRRKALDFDEYLATGRPYVINEENYPYKFERLLDITKSFKESQVSNSFIHSLYKIILDPNTFDIELNIKLKRLYNKHPEHPELESKFTEYIETISGSSNDWYGKNFEGKKSLSLIDIAEIYDWV